MDYGKPEVMPRDLILRHYFPLADDSGSTAWAAGIGNADGRRVYGRLIVGPDEVIRMFISPSLTPEGSGQIVLRRDNAEIRSCCYVRSASSPGRKVSLHR
jgi:hypothetical protein